MKKIFKAFLCVIIFLILGIICKSNYKYRSIIHYYLYEDSFDFNSVYSFYNKYLGGISFYNNKDKIRSVFDEKFNYYNIVEYNNGIKILVDNNYLIPSFDNGIVSFIGYKDGYGNVLIIKIRNDINIWYGNICNINYEMYDYVSKGDYIGQSCDNYIYLYYEKDGSFLDYKKYFNF